MVRDEIRFQTYGTDADYDVLLVAYGTVARVCRTAMDTLLAEGLRVALLRPITLWPFPFAALRQAAGRARDVLVVELSTGQLVEDVERAVRDERPVHLLGRCGGMLVSPDQVIDRVRALGAAAPRREAIRAL
jgi:2-oxoglutarate ferredoxin oxidoreductase subunit alpha